MGIKEQVLLLLENQKGNFFSGQEIADRLLVTRAIVILKSKTYFCV